MAFDHDLIQEIKSRADIVDIISSYIQVIKKGRRYLAVCPFHDDHDPSMNIDPIKQTYTCYVCHHSGDVFSFVSDYEKIGFADAVRKVAEIINFDDQRLHKKETIKPVNVDIQVLYNCANELNTFYQYGLETEEGSIALDYLNKRKISKEQIEKFKFGYALKDGKMAISYLKQKGFSLKNIEDIGIALAQANATSDSNAGRLIIPIANANGQIIGFSARRLTNDDNSPKYVNSPETKIFRKGSNLYNYNNAKQTARHDGYIYVVEGFMDVLALDAIGISSCVALMGTKLTEQHINLLRMLNCEIRLCLDSDKPGQEAMMSLTKTLDKSGLNYRLVYKNGEAKDPDEILKTKGDDVLKAYVNSLVDPFEFALNYYKNISPLDSLDDRKKVVSHFAPKLIAAKSDLEFNDLVFKLADATKFNPNAIKEYIKNIKNNDEGEGKSISFTKFNGEEEMNKQKLNKQLRRLTLAEKTLLSQMMTSKTAVEYYEKNVKYFYTEIYRQIANYLIQFIEDNNEVNPSIIMDYISSFDPENRNELINEIISIDAKPVDQSELNDVLNECGRVIIDERSKNYEKRNLMKSLEGKSDLEKAKLLQEYINKTNKIE